MKQPRPASGYAHGAGLFLIKEPKIRLKFLPFERV